MNGVLNCTAIEPHARAEDALQHHANPPAAMQAATPPIETPAPAQRAIRLIVIHCLDVPNGRHITLADLARWHLERGFDEFQYHHFIDVSGAVVLCRAHERIGRHTRGWNDDSVGIVLAGRNQFTPPQWRALADLVEGLAVQYQIPLEVPDFMDGRVSGVAGHCDLPNTINRRSPNFSVRDWLAGGMDPLPGHVLPGAGFDLGARRGEAP